MPKIWINCGELSGDLQSAELVKALKEEIALNASDKNIDFVGMGGEYLKEQGVRTLFHIRELSVMGISEVIGALPRIWGLLKRIKKTLAAERPDAIIVTDAPDFNFRIINMAKELEIPVYYFIPPKVWAWRKYRLKFLQENVKKIYSILPFEVEFYQKNKVAIEYIGNPLVNIVNAGQYLRTEVHANRIALMPGSRKKEVSSLLPVYAEMAGILKKYHPDFEFYLIQAPHFTEEYLRSFWKSPVPLHLVKSEDRYGFLAGCEMVVAASGTAVLETALLGVPTLVTYKIKPLSYLLGKMFVHVKYVSLPNLILNNELFPELLQGRANPYTLSEFVKAWHENGQVTAEIRRGCELVRTMLGDGDSARRFARDFVKEI